MADVAKESPHLDGIPDPQTVLVEKKRKGNTRSSRAKKDLTKNAEGTPSNTEVLQLSAGDTKNKKPRSRRGGKGRKREDTSSPESGAELGASVCKSAEVTCDSAAIETAVEEKKVSKSQRSKRNKRAVKSKSDEGGHIAEQRASGSLSLDELAFLKKIQEHSAQPLKTGQISVAELMGTDKTSGASLLQRLIEKPMTAENVMKAAVKERPPVPGFSRGFPYSHSHVRPELLNSAMEVFRKASYDHNRRPVHDGRGRSPRVGGSGYRSDVVGRLPWIPLTPMYPLDERPQKSLPMFSPVSRRNPQQPAYNSYSTPSSTNRNSSPLHSSSNHSMNNQVLSNQKMRKAFFMPYYSGEYVSRGLAMGELIKGSLRVNQRNYEESQIDNPEGHDQLDLLILGLHDRNRALHGDVVVVRIKERSQWVVRDGLYQAWRNGQLGVSVDDDGKPMTVPPVPSPRNDNIVEVILGGTADIKINKEQLLKKVPASSDFKYTRSDMLLMGAQSELKRLGKLSLDESHKTGVLDADLEALIDSLSLSRHAAPLPSVTTPVRTIPVKRSLGVTNRKVPYKLLADMPAEDWGVPDFCLQKTAEVVFVAEQKNCRAAMGHLKMMPDGNRNWALFSPTDSRMPRMMIPAEQTPSGFFERPQDFTKFIFVARMVEWQATAQFARGRLERSLGLAGDIEAETEGLLFSNDVDSREFSSEVLNSLPSTDVAWTVPEEEVKSRLDLRNETVFTIDNKAPMEKNGAIHIKRKENDGTVRWELGVHVPDVSYFLKEGSELDKWAAKRANSVYLVHKVIPMLPKTLCEDVCALSPGIDRLALSVIWEVDNDGKILQESFARSIVRSKAHITFAHAQQLLDGGSLEDADFSSEVFVSKIQEMLLQLDMISEKLRLQRGASNDFSLELPALLFSMDANSKTPSGVSVSEKKRTNTIVEELMLLADIRVAQRIESAYPNTALLCRQPEPKQKVIREVEELCEKMGFHLDGVSPAELRSSLLKYSGNDSLCKAIRQVLTLHLAKAMQQPQYFCVGTLASPENCHHYTLGCPYYTHFTSPLHRYADVLVHRFLVATLGSGKAPSMSIQEIEKQAQHCNDKKIAAAAVREGSNETFLGMFVQDKGPFEERGIVVNVCDTAVDVLIIKYCIVKRVYINKLDMARDPIFVEGPSPKLTLFWNTKGTENSTVEQIIQMSSVVDLVLSALPEPTKFQALIKMCSSDGSRTLSSLLAAGEPL